MRRTLTARLLLIRYLGPMREFYGRFRRAATSSSDPFCVYLPKLFWRRLYRFVKKVRVDVEAEGAGAERLQSECLECFVHARTVAARLTDPVVIWLWTHAHALGVICCDAESPIACLAGATLEAAGASVSYDSLSGQNSTKMRERSWASVTTFVLSNERVVVPTFANDSSHRVLIVGFGVAEIIAGDAGLIPSVLSTKPDRVMVV